MYTLEKWISLAYPRHFQTKWINSIPEIFRFLFANPLTKSQLNAKITTKYYALSRWISIWCLNIVTKNLLSLYDPNHYSFMMTISFVEMIVKWQFSSSTSLRMLNLFFSTVSEINIIIIVNASGLCIWKLFRYYT